MPAPKVTLSNHASWTRVEVDPSYRDEVYRRLSDRYSYLSDGRFFSPAWRAGGWDGRVSLVERVKGAGLLFPAGFRQDAEDTLRKAGFEVDAPPLDDTGDRLPAGARWIGPDRRDYQDLARAAAARSRRGILEMPTRSGKTFTAASITLDAGLRTLFVVTSDILLNQAVKAFRSCLGGVRVTSIGGGEWDDEGDVVVASVQTLVARNDRKAYDRLCRRSFGIVFNDECHHASGTQGDVWRNALMGIDAGRKYGLSATVDMRPLHEQEPWALWLQGVCGPVIFSLTASDLIDRGYLAPLTVSFHRHRAPVRPEKKWSSLMYKAAITQCDERNRRLVDCIMEYARTRPGVIVDCGRVEHANILNDLLDRVARSGEVGLLIGPTTGKQRGRLLDGFREGRVKVLVSTVLGEGVDLPECWAVANAEGGQATVSTMQRLRCLTPTSWKAMAHCIEMADHHHKVLKKWTLERAGIYRQHPRFLVRYEKPLPGQGEKNP